jgi:hypothetical protein
MTSFYKKIIIWIIIFLSIFLFCFLGYKHLNKESNSLLNDFGNTRNK